MRNLRPALHRRQSGAASDEDDQGLSKSGRELQKLLRGAASDSEGREGTPAGKTAAGAAEEGSESVYEDDDELDDAELDDDYLDRMVGPRAHMSCCLREGCDGSGL